MKSLIRGLAVFLVVTLVGCGRGKDPEVKFTLSNWFNGNLVDIRLDEEKGIEIPFREGRYEVDIPASGVVYFKSLDLFANPHTETVAYQGGASIPLPTAEYAALNHDRKYWWPTGQSTLRSDGKEITTRLIYRIAKPNEVAPVDVFALADRVGIAK